MMGAMSICRVIGKGLAVAAAIVALTVLSTAAVVMGAVGAVWVLG